MRSYEEYCPIAVGSEVLGERWMPLVIRELSCGSERFSDIHRGVPRMSRTLLADRLRQLERLGLVERPAGGGYRLTAAGVELADVVWHLGRWANTWMPGDPTEEHTDGVHLMWRIRQGVVASAIPSGCTVVQFDLRGARRGRRMWLLLEPEATRVCENDEGFEIDVWVDVEVTEMLRIWSGRATWPDAIRRGALRLDGPRELVRAFPSWFALSPFATV